MITFVCPKECECEHEQLKRNANVIEFYEKMDKVSCKEFRKYFSQRLSDLSIPLLFVFKRPEIFYFFLTCQDIFYLTKIPPLLLNKISIVFKIILISVPVNEDR